MGTWTTSLRLMSTLDVTKQSWNNEKGSNKTRYKRDAVNTANKQHYQSNQMSLDIRFIWKAIGSKNPDDTQLETTNLAKI